MWCNICNVTVGSGLLEANRYYGYESANSSVKHLDFIIAAIRTDTSLFILLLIE